MRHYPNGSATIDLMKSDWFGALTSALPPPEPANRSPAAWRQAEAHLGVRFPPDVKRVVETYGWADIDGVLALYDPRDTRHYLAGGIRERLEALRQDFETGNEKPPLPGWPGGSSSLLPLTHNSNGDMTYVVVSDGEASDSPLWIGNRRNLEWVEISGPLSRLLLGVVGATEMPQGVLETFSPEVWQLRPIVTARLTSL